MTNIKIAMVQVVIAGSSAIALLQGAYELACFGVLLVYIIGALEY